jgi:putative FmdB family regulatory protein
MPTYTYRCENCGHQFDIYQGFTDQPLKACPKCKKRVLYKIYQPSGVSFKGSGFYVTDKRSSSRSTKETTKAKENGKSESKTEKAEGKSEKAEGKSEKSEVKTEKKSETPGEKSKPQSKDE